jgi:hypothetical protein
MERVLLIEISPHPRGWKVFEAPGVEPVFQKKHQLHKNLHVPVSDRRGQCLMLRPQGDFIAALAN